MGYYFLAFLDDVIVLGRSFEDHLQNHHLQNLRLDLGRLKKFGLKLIAKKCILVTCIVDRFTKWVECIPLPSQTAEVTACAAVNKFFCQFACPLQIFTDQGRNFESNLFVQV